MLLMSPVLSPALSKLQAHLLGRRMAAGHGVLASRASGVNTWLVTRVGGVTGLLPGYDPLAPQPRPLSRIYGSVACVGGPIHD
jgi:hypothetical protein